MTPQYEDLVIITSGKYKDRFGNIVGTSYDKQNFTIELSFVGEDEDPMIIIPRSEFDLALLSDVF